MALVLVPEPDEPTRRAVAVALAGSPAANGAYEAYASAWRLAGLAEAAGLAEGFGAGGDEDGLRDRRYARSPRSSLGVTRA